MSAPPVGDFVTHDLHVCPPLSPDKDVWDSDENGYGEPGAMLVASSQVRLIDNTGHDNADDKQSVHLRHHVSSQLRID